MPISTEFGIKHPWVLGIQICLYKETHNREIVKTIHIHLKASIPEPLGHFHPNLVKKSLGNRK